MCFFFQAEDGIRDLTVTGVQTCALPISSPEIQFGRVAATLQCAKGRNEPCGSSSGPSLRSGLLWKWASQETGRTSRNHGPLAGEGARPGFVRRDDSDGRRIHSERIFLARLQNSLSYRPSGPI